MGRHDSNPETDTFAGVAAFAEAVEEVRENTRAVVAGLMADGFSEEQARDITAGLFRTMGRTKAEGGETDG